MSKIILRLLSFCLTISVLFVLTVSCGNNRAAIKGLDVWENLDYFYEHGGR